MNKHILSHEYYSDPSSQRLVDYIESHVEGLEDANIYYHYPIIREIDEDLKFPSLLLISPNHGVVLFKCDGINTVRQNDTLEAMIEELTRIEDILFSKLIKSQNKKMKSSRRELAFNLVSALYIPNYLENKRGDKYDIEVLISNNDLKTFFEQLSDKQIEADVLREIYAIIENSTAIVKPKERKVEKDDTSSMAYILKKLEEEIANFDDEQKYAALSQLEGPQRIRGLAGSGKTIILCMKAAILHLRYPDKKILYTFMTKSLYDYIELLITRFYKVLGDGQLPDFDNSIQIQHAWGGSNLKGVYFDSCRRNNINPVNFNVASKVAGSKDAFNFICNDLLEKTKGSLEQVYDYVLIDEAQDFKPSFYQLCRAIVKKDCIVWGYDNLQNIFDVNIQDTVSTFENKHGASGIDLRELQKKYPDMDNDIVLSRCYRNPREILVTAHALGFGVYNDKLIQTLENNSHWEDHGYKVIKGYCENGDEMIIERPLKNSPLSISKYQSTDDIIKLKSASNFDDEVEWVCDSIQNAIFKEKLRADDIIVISLDDRNVRLYSKEIGEKLYDMGINSHNLSSNTYEKGFTEDECVTISTVYKAKGHEAAMVFVVGTDVLEKEKNNLGMRNRVFTAFTRAKAWLRVSGVKIKNHSIWNEIQEVKDNDFKLIFTYKESYIIQRDLDEINIKKAEFREMYQTFHKGLKSKGFTEDEISKFFNAKIAGDDIDDDIGDDE